MEVYNLTKTQARIIIYLNHVPPPLRYAEKISIKLGMDKGYISNTINQMKEQQWIIPDTQHGKKTYYKIKNKEIIQQAAQIITESETNAKTHQ